MDLSITEYPFPLSIDETLLLLTVKGDPVPAARARVTRFGTYTPARYLKYRRALSEFLKLEFKPLSDDCFYYDIPPKDRCFGVRARFYRSTFQRTDVDNLVKSVLDAGTSILWEDDSQVTEVFAKVIRGSADPRVEIAVYEIEPDGLTVCKECGRSFKAVSWRKAQKFCGIVCRNKSDKSKWQTAICEQCAGPFQYLPCMMRNRTLRFCSRPCILRHYREKARENYSPKLCCDCQQRVSRPEYVRCYACNLTVRQPKKGETVHV